TVVGGASDGFQQPAPLVRGRGIQHGSAPGEDGRDAVGEEHLADAVPVVLSLDEDGDVAGAHGPAALRIVGPTGPIRDPGSLEQVDEGAGEIAVDLLPSGRVRHLMLTAGELLPDGDVEVRPMADLKTGERAPVGG